MSTPRKIIIVITKLAEAEINTIKRAAGGGQRFKLEADNEGLLCLALSLNMGSSPSMATCICNSINHNANPGMADADFKLTFQIFQNILFNTLRDYADV